MTKEEFGSVFQESLDAILEAMAENQEIDPEKFYNMTCILENLSFFSPILYNAIRSKKL
ncbi:hypothetical protein [uncultured Pontibacter sp.]|uniref:hypothetical protein n=1 Tax=uncultured Pontibacter sp. TaxID=453356 RepID=UPI0026127BB4|nr:hypothetical protein [uncultured Pontibacter sp.]